MAISNNKPALVADIVNAMYEFSILKAKVDNAVDRYYKTGVSADVAALGAGVIVPGTQIDKENLQNAITAFEQFQKYCNNQAVAQAEYIATILKVAALKGL